MSFTDKEIAYLTSQPFGRLATVGAAGDPHVVPVGLHYNPELGTIDIGGIGLGRSRKYRDARARPRVAIVVDDLDPDDPTAPRGIEIRGTAEALARGGRALGGPVADELIRITPTRIVSWGIEEHWQAGPFARSVPAADRPTEGSHSRTEESHDRGESPMDELTHEITAAAPARLLYDLVADVVAAPRYFPTHLHAEVVGEPAGNRDLVARWVIDNGAVRGWRLWRTQDTDNLVIAFEHETPKPPLSAMRGEWRFEETAGGTRIRVRHSFGLAPGTDPAAAGKVAAQLDGNVPRQLAQIAELAGRIDALRAATVTDEQSVRIAAPRAEVESRAAGLLTEDAGWIHVTPSEGHLVLKQHTGLAPHLHSATGSCHFTEEAGGTTVRLRRTLTLTPEATPEDIATARKQLHTDLHAQLTALTALIPAP
ncbi:PPOX class F420-dependent oxidoreductase [Streptomyces sp. bgisy159]|uniref:PPOX class F420-dependent oxidoreductase n=1 Tax=Streptomyces sp. bgisy159 TaxID=3413795 RepID=UPI003F4A4658